MLIVDGYMLVALRTALGMISIVSVGSCAWETALVDHPHYDISIEIDPARHYLDVSVDLTFKSPAFNLHSATFVLHRELEVTAVDGGIVASYEFDRASDVGIPWIPAGAWLSVSFNEPLDSGQTTLLHFEYRGAIDAWEPWSANVLTEDWAELGLYFPWFPYNYTEYGPFTYDVRVSIDSIYEVTGLGDVERVGSEWSIRTKRAVNDIVLMAARDLQTIRVESDGYVVHASYTTLNDSTATGLAEDLVFVLSTYSDWFGARESRLLTLVETKREMGGGYARPGLIVLSRLAERTSPEHRADLMRYVAHELAHFWWSLAPAANWEDWLNESFAEYSALLVLQDRYGHAEYHERIDQKRQASEGSPAIWGFDRSDNTVAQSVLYNAGPVILHDLSSQTSDARFLDWCKELFSRNVSSTERALEVLRELEGENTAEWLEAHLRN